MMYVIFLSENKLNNKASKQSMNVAELREDIVGIYYNAALTYFRMGRFYEALTNAHRVDQQGFSPPGISDKLNKAGKW